MVRDAGMGWGIRNGETELGGWVQDWTKDPKGACVAPGRVKGWEEGPLVRDRASALWVVVEWGSELRTWGRWALFMHRCWGPGIEHPQNACTNHAWMRVQNEREETPVLEGGAP